MRTGKAFTPYALFAPVPPDALPRTRTLEPWAKHSTWWNISHATTGKLPELTDQLTTHGMYHTLPLWFPAYNGFDPLVEVPSEPDRLQRRWPRYGLNRLVEPAPKRRYSSNAGHAI